MIRTSFQNIFAKHSLLQFSSTIRSVRSVARRESVPKVLEGKVKTVTNYDEGLHIKSYEDFVEDMKQSNFGDEIEAEKYFAEEEHHGEALERCDQYFNFYSNQEKGLKSYIKKQIIKRKYFKLDQETNLLTYAAKEQIRFLHKTEPLEWNCKAISECFPISEEGAKKLLKCNFVLKSPEAIKAHDEQVAERWKILKSGKVTNTISPLTLKLYKEGKLVDDYCSGNPNLPTTPPSKKVIQFEKKKEIGEFSAIVQTYVNYQNQKLLTCSKDESSESQLSLRDSNKIESSKNEFKTIKKFKYADEELDSENSNIKSTPKTHAHDADVPLSQFKEILKEESQSKSQLQPQLNKHKDYELLKGNIKNKELYTKQPYEAEDCFVKISKYDKTDNVSAMYDRKNGNKLVYTYNENTGYQYPLGKQIKERVHLSSKQFRKGKLHKVGQSVYDDKGEFLYKVPT